MAKGDLKDLVQLVKQAPISSVIQRYISIKSQGRNHVSVCPFHDDRNPSMLITDSRGMYKCFSCGAGGDVIKFVQEYKHLDFKEALKEISEHLGYDYNDYVTQFKKNPKKEMAEKILSRTAQIYRKLAEAGNVESFETFLKERGISAEIAKTFSLGFSPGNNTITNYLYSIPNQAQRQMAVSVC